MNILQHEISKLNTDWKTLLLSLSTPDKEYSEMNISEIYPKLENIFRCFSYFDISETKVVIIGQDPYHSPEQAIGLSFGVSNSIKKIPPSLQNIEKLLKKDISIELHDKTLESWAKQGVLLLNSSLTVKHKSPSSHNKIWMKFTSAVIEYLNNNLSNIVFVAWGAHAYNLLSNIDDSKHHIIVSSHPSPLSCRRKFKHFPSFEESNHFSKINSMLEDKISW